MRTKKLSKSLLRAMLLFVTTLVGFSSCDKDDDDMDGVTGATVKLSENATHGKYLTCSEGMTLYFFSKDTKGISECVDGCLDAWPVFYKEGLVAGEGLKESDFGTITRTDGTKQNTYMGWPLYFFANDKVAGDVKGDKVNNVWYVAKPDYSLMYATAQLVGDDGKNYMINGEGEYVEGEGATFYITDAKGMTLYAFVNDTYNKNNFTKEDFSNNSVWPIAEITLDKIPSILNRDDFGVIDVFGKKQLTYKGWPLYYFGKDKERGDNKGISVPAPGKWPVVNTETEIAPEK